MNCDRSFKRDMLIRWGLRQMIDHGKSRDEVSKTITKMMKKTTEEIKVFIKKEKS